METQEKKLNRVEVIFALAQYCHPSWYHSILTWPTNRLIDLLNYYEKPEPEHTLADLMNFLGVSLGIDFALEGSEQTIFTHIFKI